jgi:SPP1 family predicted phage head-tail adaptor
MLQSRIRTGELDRKVTFIKKVITTPGTNEDAVTGWTTIASNPTPWARKKDLPGIEVFENDRITYKQRTVWTIRHRDDLTTENRLVFNTRVYNILSVTDHESGRERFIDVLTELVDTELYT